MSHKLLQSFMSFLRNCFMNCFFREFSVRFFFGKFIQWLLLENQKIWIPSQISQRLDKIIIRIGLKAFLSLCLFENISKVLIQRYFQIFLQDISLSSRISKKKKNSQKIHLGNYSTGFFSNSSWGILQGFPGGFSSGILSEFLPVFIGISPEVILEISLCFFLRIS